MSRNMAIFWDAFFDGISGAGLFSKLRRPGAPTCLVDTRSVEEVKASGEFARMLKPLKR